MEVFPSSSVPVPLPIKDRLSRTKPPCPLTKHGAYPVLIGGESQRYLQTSASRIDPSNNLHPNYRLRSRSFASHYPAPSPRLTRTAATWKPCQDGPCFLLLLLSKLYLCFFFGEKLCKLTFSDNFCMPGASSELRTRKSAARVPQAFVVLETSHHASTDPFFP
ncbi:uncharacterized protein BKA78DRAFT_179233 [Phyllosticta capitalensis]|uniref:uncharacterized protein n=1 Tax=Phyllosticta capitalensis TaxID=121624 RepID=UPI00312F8B8D